MSYIKREAIHKMLDELLDINIGVGAMLSEDCVRELINDTPSSAVVELPCKIGDWIWYIYRNEINKAKVEEIQYDASKHGYYSYSFNVYAYDFKNKRQVSYYPINETTKNKANINKVEGMDYSEDVYVFLTREEAEKALAERSEGEG